MSATQKEREQFLSALQAEFPPERAAEVLAAGRLLLRHARTHARLAEESCNRHPAQSSPTMSAERIGKLQDQWDTRIERDEKRIERRITGICAGLGIKPNFGGDPRGFTVKLFLPSGRYNTMGGREDGYGVPS